MSKHEQRKGRFSFPRWAVGTAVVMIAVGAVVLSTSEARARSDALAALNGTDIKLLEDQNGKEISDGFDDGFGLIIQNDHREEYERLLDDRRSELAHEVFVQVLEKGTWQGRALACHMAFYLARTDHLTEEDLQRVAAQLDHEKVELRRVAQRELSHLIVLRDGEKTSRYTKIEAPAGTKGPLEARTEKISLMEAPPDTQWLSLRWSNPEACKAWWKTFGPRAKWDGGLKRFVLTD
jgi:hypothetical protein